MSASDVSKSTSEATRHLLVVDDDEEMRSMTCDVLRALGFRTSEAATRGDAMTVVRSGGVDAVLTDIGLEGKSSSGGLELCKEIRNTAPNVALFVLSGDHTQRSAALAAGAREFWLKPANVRAIAVAIGAALGTR